MPYVPFTRHHRKRPGQVGRLLVVCVAAAGTTVGVLAPTAASAAPAVVNSPPANGHSIIVFPQRDFIHADGYAATDVLTVQDIRNGVVIGTSAGVIPQDDPATPTFDGLFDLNHIGVPCWNTTTPDLLPGDVIRITDQFGVADETPTAAVVVTQPATLVGTTIVMRGTAADAAGLPLAAGAFESRLIANKLAFDANGKRSLRASAVYDAPGSTNWTATWSGLDAHDQSMAVAAESRVLWLGRLPGATANALGSPIESTIYEYGAVGGPAAGCAAPQSSYAVTSTTPTALNLASNTGPLVLSGLSQDASAVSVTLTDAAGATVTSAPVAPTPATGPQTWTVTIPAVAHNTLADGPLRAAGAYTTGGVVITGAPATLLKDTVAPAAPSATPAGGTYLTSQAVTLANAENLPMYATVDGTVPTPASPRVTGQILVTASQTVNVIALDPAGNPSPVSSNAYLIVHAVAPSAPNTVVAAAGNGEATVTWSPPTSDGGSAVTSYLVHALTLTGARPADAVVTAGTSLTMTGLTNGAAYAFDVLATNLAGSGAIATSNAVTPVTVPGAPTVGTATAGVTAATVTWSPPVGDGGSPVTGYTVTATTATGGFVSAPAGPTSTSLTVNGLTAGTVYTLTVTAINGVGAGASSAASNPVTPLPVPTVTAKSPAAGATSVPLGTTTARLPVTATFSGNVVGVGSTTFTLKLGTTAVPALVTYNTVTHVATLTPSAPLVADRTYIASLAAGIRGSAGGAVVAQSWTFVTGPAPTLIAKSPATGAIRVSRLGNVTATFSENVVGLPTVAAASVNFTLRNTTTGVAFPSAVTYSAATHVATLNPSGTLLANTRYTATLASTIKDVAGNRLALSAWTFTTGTV